ncbi:MAG: glycosyltransferase family protein [Thermoleophilia bacterium]
MSGIRGWGVANRVLLALLLLAAAKSVLWSVAIPPWRAPDEHEHFGYIEYLSKEHSIPLYGNTYFYPDVFESLSRTNFHGIAGSESTVVDPQTRQLNPASMHPPLYYTLMLPVYEMSTGASVETQLYVVRIFGGLIFLALIAVAYRLAMLVFPGAPYMQMGVPLLMIFHPQLAFISAGGMNDALLTLLFTFYLYQLVVFAKGDFSLRRAAVIGVVIGLGMMTKSSFLVTYPIGLAVIAVLFVRRRDQRRRLLQAIGVALAVSLPIFAWYYLRNYIELGEWQPGNKSERYHATGWWNLLSATPFRADLISSFLGNFSWLSMPLPDRVLYWFRRVAELASLGLMLSVALGYWRRGRRLLEPWLMLLFAGIFSFFVVMAAYFELTFGGAQGRYLFPADFAFWSLMLVGLVGWMPASWRPRVTAAVVALAACFSVWTLYYEFLGRVT